MICKHDRKLYLWVPHPESIAGLHNDLDALRDNCREAQVPIRGLAISLVETGTEGAWVSEDGEDVSGVNLWDVGNSGTFGSIRTWRLSQPT